MPEHTIVDTLSSAVVDAVITTFGHSTGCDPEPQDFAAMIAALDVAREQLLARKNEHLIDRTTALHYLAALRGYASAESEGTPLPDDAVSMLADVEEWIEAQS